MHTLHTPQCNGFYEYKILQQIKIRVYASTEFLIKFNI
jgi:hypothetical protein